MSRHKGNQPAPQQSNNANNQAQATQQAASAAAAPKPATTTSLASEPTYLTIAKSYLPPAEIMVPAIFLGLVALFYYLISHNEGIYKENLANKDIELYNAQHKLDQLEQDKKTLTKEMAATNTDIEQLKWEITNLNKKQKTLAAENSELFTDNTQLLNENTALKQKINDWKLQLSHIDKQFKSHTTELSSAYGMFKADLESARGDEIDQIRQKAELIIKALREEYLFKEQEQVKLLQQSQIELEEMGKLIKEKNPTLYTAVQKELRNRVQTRINGENRKRDKKQGQIANNETKLIEPAK